MPHPHRRCLTLAGIALWAGVGCQPATPAGASATPKPAAASAPASSLLPGPLPTDRTASAPANTRFPAPAGWGPGRTSSMRLASYTAGPAEALVDISVTQFSGPAGGGLANVNRWRGQVGLPALADEAALAATAQPVHMDGQPASLVVLEGEQQAILGAWQTRAKSTFFVKAMGPTAAVKAQREAFDQFLSQANGLAELDAATGG